MSDCTGNVFCIHFIIQHFIDTFIESIFFSLFNDFGHYFYSFHRILTHSAFTGQHYCGSSIEYGVGNVCDFCTCRSRACHHGFQHLSSCDDQFSCFAAFLDQLLLETRKLRVIYFHAHVAAGNHDAVGMFYNAFEVVDTFDVFDFGNDFDIASAVVVEEVSQVDNVLCSTYEGSCNVIDIHFDTEQEIGFISRAQVFQIKMSLRNVHAFAVADFAAVSNLADNIFAFQLFYLKGYAAVVYQDSSAGANLCCEIFICDAAAVHSAFDFIRRKCEQLPVFQDDTVVFESPQSDFRTFCIQKYSS